MDREKVIKGLECCSVPSNKRDCDLCPIEFGEGCALKLKRGALALLKAQEPRLLTLEEAKTVEGYVWTECCDTHVLRVSLFRNGYFIEPLEEPFPVDSMNWPGYNKQWRYWTSRPTDKQREAAPWET